MNPKVSIIIPSFNDDKELPGLLDSIIKQSYTNYEVLVIDGGSSDETEKIIQNYSNYVHYFISEPDRGIYDAMNKGIKVSKGEWLYFTGCDDRLYNENVLDSIFNSDLPTHSHVLYGKIFNKAKNLIVGEVINKDIELMTKSLWHQSMFYKKVVFESAGLYNLNYKISADVFFNLTLFTQFDFNWTYTNLVVSSFSGEGISSEISDKKYHSDLIHLYKKWFPKASDFELYNGFQHHMYNEAKIGSTINAFIELLIIVWKTKKIRPYLKNFLYYTKHKLKTYIDIQ